MCACVLAGHAVQHCQRMRCASRIFAKVTCLQDSAQYIVYYGSTTSTLFAHVCEQGLCLCLSISCVRSSR